MNLPATYTASGKRERRFYPKKMDALAAAAKLKERIHTHGLNAAAIAPHLAIDAARAAALLEPYGRTLTEAAQALVDTLAAAAASAPLGEALEAWMHDARHLRPATLNGYRQVERALLRAIPAETILATISTAQLSTAIHKPKMGETSRANLYRACRIFWNFACREKWAVSQTLSDVKPPKITAEAGEIGFLSPAEAERLLRTAEAYAPRFVAHFALSLFAGIRREEILRLTAADVSPDGIELSASATKKGRRRHIVPSITLRAWLQAYPFQPSPSWRVADMKTRFAAGWRVRPLRDVIEETPEEFAARPKWPQNAGRHSHATYAVASGVPLEQLLFEFGHSGGPGLLRAHYVGRASKAEAVKFFNILPLKK